MEAFDDFKHKFDYAIVGHSGESSRVPFVDFGEPPGNRKERLKVLQTMFAHTQFCMAGGR
jgi:hypothetical protein